MTYLAITIGPIYKTMKQARSTRELWSSSFIFSILMRNLVAEFSKYGAILSPSSSVSLPLSGAGVYPDRCFFRLKEPLSPQTINEIKKVAWSNFIEQTGLQNSHYSYFQIYIVQENIAKSPIQRLNMILDGLELTTRIDNSNKLDLNDYWADSSFFQNLYKHGYGNDSILPPIKIIYKNGNVSYSKRFKSVPEISTAELEKKYPENYWKALGIQYVRTKDEKINFEQLQENFSDEIIEDNIINELKKAFPDDFRVRHKYFAIVQADGDNVGSLIKEIEAHQGNILDFSAALNKFVKESAEEIVNYGAFPIYMGGDDLLFFAPISNFQYETGVLEFGQFSDPQYTNADMKLQGDNIFFLLTKLNKLFKNNLGPIVNQYMEAKPVSLSFGVSFGYYKKPMNEIQEESYNLLFYNAKLQPNKDFIALRLEKHSGQTFEFGFNQGSKLYYHFLKLCRASSDKKENFLNSVMFKINNQQKLICEIAHEFNKLVNFFNENFNEAGHKAYKEFFTEVSHIIVETFKYFSDEKPRNADLIDMRISRVYSTLRFIQFLNALDSHE